MMMRRLANGDTVPAIPTPLLYLDPKPFDEYDLAALGDELVSRDEFTVWLDRPVPSFDGMTPKQVIENGGMQRVVNMLIRLIEGQTI